MGWWLTVVVYMYVLQTRVSSALGTPVGKCNPRGEGSNPQLESFAKEKSGWKRELVVARSEVLGTLHKLFRKALDDFSSSRSSKKAFPRASEFGIGSVQRKATGILKEALRDRGDPLQVSFRVYWKNLPATGGNSF